MPFVRLLERTSKISARVAVAMTSGDCVTKHIATASQGSTSGVHRSALFNPLNYSQHLRRSDFADWALSEPWENVIGKPRIDALAVSLGFGINELPQPLPSNCLEAIL